MSKKKQKHPKRHRLPPLIFVGFLRSAAEEMFAPEIIHRAGKGECSQCGAELICVSGDMVAFREMARVHQRKFILLCPLCAETDISSQAASSAATPVIVELPLPEDLARIQQRYKLSRN